MSVAAIEDCESNCCTTLPFTHTSAQSHSQLVAFASNAKPKLFGVSPTYDPLLFVDALVQGKVVLAFFPRATG